MITPFISIYTTAAYSRQSNFSLGKLFFQQSLRIEKTDKTVYLILLVVIAHTSCSLCSVAELGGDVPKVRTAIRLQIGVHGHWLVLHTPCSKKRINWKCSELKLIPPSQGSKRASLVQSGDFPGEVPPSSDMPTTIDWLYVRKPAP